MKKTHSNGMQVILLMLVLSFYVYLLPPKNYVYGVVLIVTIAITLMKAVAVFTRDRLIPRLVLIFTVIFLLLQSAIGFNVLNTILLASFIIGIGIFSKQK